MKVIAFYLPQFHAIEENDKWWGKGYTEWTHLKKAVPLYEGHNQPRIPLNKNYYNLLDDRVKEWQCSLANKYGVYGFCFYHYWFNGHLLLEKPLEQFLQNKKCNTHFMICWANENWTNAWVSDKSETLIAQKYGDRNEWKQHFDYFLPFFKDKRYIIEDRKPILVIYRPEIIKDLNKMLDYWEELAIENGFEGIKYAYQNINFDRIENRDDSRFDYAIESQPSYGVRELEEKSKVNKLLKNTKKRIDVITEKTFGKKINTHKVVGLKQYDYDDIWEAILSRIPTSEKYIPGAFVDWDNTPRWGKSGSSFIGVDTEKFQMYFSRLIKKAKKDYKKDMIFIFAWNEWSEGGYLEPDEKNKYGFLEAILSALEESGELPEKMGDI